MRCARIILSVATLAWYLTYTVSGHALHLGQCAAGTDCSTFSVPWYVQQAEPHAVHHCGARCHGMVEVGDQTLRGAEASRHHEHHDASRCWVCQILGQAQEEPLQIRPTVAWSTFATAVIVVPLCHASRFRSSVHTRAPPLASPGE